MRVPSAKTFVIAGFAISLISVLLNSIVLSRINARLTAADTEYNKLVESLNSQESELANADLQLGFYTIVRDLASIVPDDKKDETKADAGYFLGGSITSMYAAANDIPPTEVMKVASDELSAAFPNMDRNLKIAQRIIELQPSKNKPEVRAEIVRLAKEGERLSDEEPPPPKSETAKRIRELDKFSQEAAALNNRIAYEVKMSPLRESFLEQWHTTNSKQETRKGELASERSSLTRLSNNITYAAIALQIFGLMLILAKDLAKNAQVKPS